MKNRIIGLLLCAAMLVSTVPVGASFHDISDPATAVAAATLQGLGIVDGTGGGDFSPGGILSRAEACKMVVQMMGLSPQVETYARKTMFTDVKPTAWYNGYVNLAYAKGVINGYGDGSFGPNDSVTYGQLVTILLRMLGYQSSDIGALWPMDYTSFAQELELCGSLKLTDNQKLTREQAAILLYHTLQTDSKGASRPYYTTINGVSTTESSVLLDVSAEQGERTELLLAQLLGQSGESAYYSQKYQQSDALLGLPGTLLLDGSGRACGFIPDSEQYLEVKVSEATATTLKDSDGVSYRIPSGAKVICGSSLYPYSTTGYAQIKSKAGTRVRLCCDANGTITYLYVAGGTAESTKTAVADSASAAALASALGVSDSSYRLTKNGAEASASDIAANDVAYYDAATATIRVSDYRVSGYLAAAEPSVSAANRITVAGSSFSILDSARDDLSQFHIGSKVTLLLTDDNKVAAVREQSKLTASMLGILASDGRSVTLVGSGVTLSASEMKYDASCAGGLVTVSATGANRLQMQKAEKSDSGALNIGERTLGTLSLAASCTVFEWGGNGFVCNLLGEQGAASYDFSVIEWTETIPASYVSYYHLNSAGKVDVLLLNNVTGNCCSYGKMKTYSGREGINLGSGSLSAYNNAATLTNASGTTSKYLCALSSNGSYVGITYGKSDYSNYQSITRVQQLNCAGASESDFFLREDKWYVSVGDEDFRVSDTVQIHLTGANLWLKGSDGVANVLSDGYTLTLYYDRSGTQGGQIRVIAAE